MAPSGHLNANRKFRCPRATHSTLLLIQGNLDVKISKISDTNVTIVKAVNTFDTLSLNISNCDITIDKQISDVMVNLQGKVEVSGNKFSDHNVSISLLNLSKQFT